MGQCSRVAKGADCKSAGSSLRRFESCLAHFLFKYRAIFVNLVAHVAQAAEHILGKNEVMGSIPIVGFLPRSPEGSGVLLCKGLAITFHLINYFLAGVLFFI